jgi:excisionase family DNA binding protein
MRARKIRPPKSKLDALQRYTIEEACSFLRVSRSTLYLYIKAGSLSTIKDQKAVFVPGAEIARLSAAPQKQRLDDIPA